MDFRLSEEEFRTREEAREFAEKNLLPTILKREETGQYPLEAMRKFASQGFLGLAFGKKYGGRDRGNLAYSLAIREVSKIEPAFGLSYFVMTSLFLGGLDMFGTRDQKDRYMRDVLSGKKLGTFGITEAQAGSDVGNIQMTAKNQGDYYILNGAKVFITNGENSDYFIVIASTDRSKGSRGLSAFIVEKDMEGFRLGTRDQLMGLKTVPTSALIFKDVRIGKENLLGGEGQGFKIIIDGLNFARLGAASQALGIGEGAFDIALGHMKKREQFGQPLYKNQALAFKMAEIEAKLDQAELLLYKAIYDYDLGVDYAPSVAKAKMVCANTSMEVTTDCLQLLGARGYIKQNHIERLMRDAKTTQIHGGTIEMQKKIISDNLFRDQ